MIPNQSRLLIINIIMPEINISYSIILFKCHYLSTMMDRLPQAIWGKCKFCLYCITPFFLISPFFHPSHYFLFIVTNPAHSANPPLFFNSTDTSDTDPDSKGNDIPSLLDPSTPAATLMTGVSFLVPPEREHTDNIPEFNAIEAMKYEVSDDMPVKPFLPPTPPTQGVGNPGPSASTDGQVAAAWKTGGASPTEAADVAAGWASVFGWDVAGSHISAASPAAILLSKWDTYYLVDPYLATPDTTPDWVPPT
jgi:hypothetical protein